MTASPVRTTCAGQGAAPWAVRASASRSASAPETTRSSSVSRVRAGDHPGDVGPGDLAGAVGHGLQGVVALASASASSAVISAVALSQCWRRCGLLVEAGVLDRDAGRGRQRDDDALVLRR